MLSDEHPGKLSRCISFPNGYFNNLLNVFSVKMNMLTS